MHTAIGSLRLRSRGAHCDRILAVEVQGCTHADPELARQDRRSRLAMKIGEEGSKEEGGGRGGGGGGGRTTVIKSNNPHLAGGEQIEDIHPTLEHFKKLCVLLGEPPHGGQVAVLAGPRNTGAGTPVPRKSTETPW